MEYNPLEEHERKDFKNYKDVELNEKYNKKEKTKKN